ncbi:MAG TPA: hypothetical protein VII43_10175, partial [Opitutaceae bacterium]
RERPAVPPVSHAGTTELPHAGAADSRFDIPPPGRPERGSAPAPARAQAPAPAMHSAPAQAAPPPPREAPQTTPPPQDPRSH